MDTAAFPPPESAGRIGPNAVLQLIPVLQSRTGPILTARLMAEAGLQGPPPDHGLMPEGPAHRLHRALRQARPAEAAGILAEAGSRTADYILAHRIPGPVQTALRWMPDALAAPILSRAIARHSWTFAGSGRFTQEGTGRFSLERNPLIAGEQAAAPLCHWHVAVFERLFRTLIHPALQVRETACCACGDPACRFEVTR